MPPERVKGKHTYFFPRNVIFFLEIKNFFIFVETLPRKYSKMATKFRMEVKPTERKCSQRKVFLVP
jgi:hypothetical protein